jgi:hypothetical protein
MFFLYRVIYNVNGTHTLKFQEEDGSETKEFKLYKDNYVTEYEEILTGM